MKIYRYLLVCFIGWMVFSMSGCKIVRAVGETVVDTGKLIGIGKSDNNNVQPSENTGEIVTKKESAAKPTDGETANLMIGAFIIVLVMFLITLGIRYFYFRE